MACYSDHNEDIRTKGSCDYCHGTTRDPVEAPSVESVVVTRGDQRIVVILDHEDDEERWGSARDSAGNRVEVHVFDGDPWDKSGVRVVLDEDLLKPCNPANGQHQPGCLGCDSVKAGEVDL